MSSSSSEHPFCSVSPSIPGTKDAAGFAMVETGLTRAKNAGNIVMKNLMDFCIGTVVFILIGFGLLLGEDVVGLIGKPGLDIFTSFENFDYSNFVFYLVFCATTATIISYISKC